MLSIALLATLRVQRVIERRCGRRERHASHSDLSAGSVVLSRGKGNPRICISGRAINWKIKGENSWITPA